uniref:Uncharacterized protein n=1 Tax=Lepeophtheirus salmonis TaxID=72036 RepID=A0A0K2VF04_LEPSM
MWSFCTGILCTPNSPYSSLKQQLTLTYATTALSSKTSSLYWKREFERRLKN